MLIPVFINVRFMFFMLISGVNFTVQYRSSWSAGSVAFFRILSFTSIFSLSASQLSRLPQL